MRSAYISFDHEDAKLLRYGANHNGKRAVIKIEIETSDPNALAWMLRDLAKAQLEGELHRKALAEQQRAAKKASAPKPLALPFYGDRS